jgi:hypothetical protein
MLAWHVPYLGWTRLPGEVSEFEIAYFFTLRAEERSAVLSRYRDSLRLGAALQIWVLENVRPTARCDSACAGRFAQTFG